MPILNALLETPQRLFALVLTPTRELAFQISEQFEALGSSIGVQCGECLRSSKRPGCHHKWEEWEEREESAGSVLWSEELVLWSSLGGWTDVSRDIALALRMLSEKTENHRCVFALFLQL